MNACMHASMHTCIHAYKHTHIHTYIYTCIHAANIVHKPHTYIVWADRTSRTVHMHTYSAYSASIHPYIHAYIAHSAQTPYTHTYSAYIGWADRHAGHAVHTYIPHGWADRHCVQCIHPMQTYIPHVPIQAYVCL